MMSHSESIYLIYMKLRFIIDFPLDGSEQAVRRVNRVARKVENIETTSEFEENQP